MHHNLSCFFHLVVLGILDCKPISWFLLKNLLVIKSTLLLKKWIASFLLLRLLRLQVLETSLILFFSVSHRPTLIMTFSACSKLWMVWEVLLRAKTKALWRISVIVFHLHLSLLCSNHKILHSTNTYDQLWPGSICFLFPLPYNILASDTHIPLLVLLLC